MTNEEQAVAVATGGLALATVGAFLPWSRIGGRNRSGFGTADTFIGLSEGILPDAIAWVGRWWYVPAFLAVLAWATTFLAGRTVTRIAGVVLIIIALAMWWLFIFAGYNWNVIDIRLAGPLVATIGLVVILWSCTRTRASLLHGPN